jgi:hypothetical protein
LQILLCVVGGSLGRSQVLYAADQTGRSLFEAPPAVLPPLPAQPTLLQHADGRFFAANVNLRPGQFFQTPDGRVFTLAATAAAADGKVNVGEPATGATATATASSDNNNAVASLDNRDQGASSDADVEGIVEGEDEPASILARDVIVDTTPATPTPTAARQRTTAQPQVIAAAPLTPSTARFVAAAAPFAFVPSAGPFVGGGLPAAFAGPGLAANGPLIVRLPAQVGQGGRHLLADSSTNVFRGFFSYPAAGIDFDF